MADLTLLRSTRRLTVVVVVLLAVQLSGNLYEQVVTNVEMLAAPAVQGLVGELDAGSPLFFYLPWVPIGLVLSVVLVARLRAQAPADVARRAQAALVALGAAVAAKAALISQVNPQFRDPTNDPGTLRDAAVIWAIGNAIAIIAVATAIVLLVSWRARLVDAAVSDRGVAQQPAASVSP